MMDRPDLGKPIIGPGNDFRCVGRTQNLEEANLMAQRYESEGYETQIIRKMQAGLAIYEVWISKRPDALEGKLRK